MQTTRPKTSPLIVLVALLVGAAVPILVVWNPARWDWANRLVARLYSPPAHSQQESVSKPAAPPGQKKQRKIKYWRAPMNPNYISDKPGKSPMGMDLIPVYEDEEPAESGIRVSQDFLQNYAVRTAVVEEGSIPTVIRTIGVLTYNDKNIAFVNTKFEGWLEKPKVNYIGERVRKGDVLFEVYSPQLVTTQEDYLATMDYLAKLSSGGAYPDAVARAKSLLEAARERLRYWDITDDQIAELGRSRRIKRTMEIVSPVSGIVTEKMGDTLEGMRLMPGMNVYKIADLSTVWAEIEIFEYQVQHVQLGQTAQITVDAFPGRKWTGKIIYIDPTINERTRTLKADVEIHNPDGELLPQMYAKVEIRPPAVSGAVKVPDEAILRTGERNVVIVQKSEGLFEPRDVELGAGGGGYHQVLRGLKAGEKVVTSAQFLIDSESNLKEAINKMLAEGKAKQPASAQSHQE
jgi:Cu(I)/Ag(I) efflux system membrane fusion protein